MAKLPASSDAKSQPRRDKEAARPGNPARLRPSRLVDQTKAGELNQLTKIGKGIAGIRNAATGPTLSFRTEDHKLLEAIGAPSFTATSLSGLAPSNAHQPDRPSAIAAVADIGKLVRDARKKMGMSQQRFADLAGVGRRFVSELESGKASLEIGRVLAVCKAAGIDLLARRR